MDNDKPSNYTPLPISRLRRIYRQKAYKRNILISLFFVFLAGVSLYVFLFNNEQKPEYVEAAAENKLVQSSGSVSYKQSQTSNKNLEVVVKNALKGTKGTYGIAVKNLKTGESYVVNEHQTCQAASL